MTNDMLLFIGLVICTTFYIVTLIKIGFQRDQARKLAEKYYDQLMARPTRTVVLGRDAVVEEVAYYFESRGMLDVAIEVGNIRWAS